MTTIQLPKVSCEPPNGSIKIIKGLKHYEDFTAMLAKMRVDHADLSHFISAIKTNQHNQLIDTDWYWFSERSKPEFSGFAKMDDKTYNLIKVSKEDWVNLPKNQRAYVYDGAWPMAVRLLEVNTFGVALYVQPKAVATVAYVEKPAEDHETIAAELSAKARLKAFLRGIAANFRANGDV